MSKTLPLFAAFCGLLSAILPAFSQQASFLVRDAGSLRLLALSPENSAEVFEITPDGTRVAGPFPASPRVTVALSRLAEVQPVADSVGATSWRKGVVGGFYLLEFGSVAQALAAAAFLHEQGFQAEATVARPRVNRFSSLPDDPLFPDQWFLRNTGRNRGITGTDINVVPAWESVRGRDIFIGVVDDGLQIGHPDLAANSFPLDSDPDTSMHKNFQTGELDPNPLPDQNNDLPPHGTAVAGNIAAVPNTEGVVGSAPNATLAGLVHADEALEDAPCAEAMAWRNDILHAYNNSWGPPDDGQTTAGPGMMTHAALENAITLGRDGKGVIYTWAGGNGRPARDDSNYDGFANSIYTIAIGAVSDRQLQTSEGETGANLVVVAPTSSKRRQGQSTTDLMGADGYNTNGRNDGMVIPRRNYSDLDYTNDFGMTSGATPLVTGVVALMLEANPDLGWRDVQEILLKTARRISPRDRDWRQNLSTGLWFNHKFGAGMVDANAAVNLAREWNNLAPSTVRAYTQDNLNLPVTPLRRGGALAEFEVPEADALRVEHVEFAVELESTRNGVLGFLLTSPSGMVSYVPPRPRDRSANFNWVFMSVRHWGEESPGIWTVRVITTAPRFPAVLNSAALVLHGVPLS